MTHKKSPLAKKGFNLYAIKIGGIINRELPVRHSIILYKRLRACFPKYGSCLLSQNRLSDFPTLLGAHNMIGGLADETLINSANVTHITFYTPLVWAAKYFLKQSFNRCFNKISGLTPECQWRITPKDHTHSKAAKCKSDVDN